MHTCGERDSRAINARTLYKCCITLSVFNLVLMFPSFIFSKSVLTALTTKKR